MPSVHAAIRAIINELPAIEKNDSGAGVPYKFRGIETLVGHLQPLMAKHGVIIVPNSTLVSIEPSRDAKPGWQDAILRVDWTIYGPEGDSITAATYGIGRDNSDKGSNKAQTQAFKYLLMELFCIGDKEDDGDSHPQAAVAVPGAAPRQGPSAAARGGGSTGPSARPVAPASNAPAAPAAPPSTPPAVQAARDARAEGAEAPRLPREHLVRLSSLRHVSNKNDAALLVELVRLIRTHANDQVKDGTIPLNVDLATLVSNDAAWQVLLQHFPGLDEAKS